MNETNTFLDYDLLIYSTVLNIIMYYYLNRKDGKNEYSVVMLKRILIAIVFVSTAEIISLASREVGNTAQMSMHYWATFVFFASNGLVAACGLGYLDYKIFGNYKKAQKRLFMFYAIPIYMNICFVGINHYNRGFVFQIDEQNRYIRGIGADISSAGLCILAAVVIGTFYRHSNLIAGRLVQNIAKIVIVPVIGSMLQIVANGTSFGTTACTIAAFLTLLLVEKDEMTRDALTQLYTRTTLEKRLQFKLNGTMPFTLLMIDLNDFKIINDTYGHLEGDSVLQEVSRILKECIKREDMVCRYGGDEFLILLEDKEDKGAEFVNEVCQAIHRYNAKGWKPYLIKLSFGYQYARRPSELTMNEMLEEVDKNMYEDKMRRKNGLSNEIQVS